MDTIALREVHSRQLGKFCTREIRDILVSVSRAAKRMASSGWPGQLNECPRLSATLRRGEAIVAPDPRRGRLYGSQLFRRELCTV